MITIADGMEAMELHMEKCKAHLEGKLIMSRTDLEVGDAVIQMSSKLQNQALVMMKHASMTNQTLNMDKFLGDYSGSTGKKKVIVGNVRRELE